MKKSIIIVVAALVGLSANAQGVLDRFTDPEKGRTVFIEKGNHAWGISGGYRSFKASGDEDVNAGYSFLTLLNIGDGRLQTWGVTPSFSVFVADDVSLGLSLDYDGYLLDTDLNLDFRDIFSSVNPAMNVKISNRHYLSHSVGASFVARRYLSFFGSKTFGVFGEGRLLANYTYTTSSPRETKVANRERLSQGLGIGVKIAGGLAVKLRDGSAITLSVPIVGVGWNVSTQAKNTLIIKDQAAYEADPNDPAATEVIESSARLSRFNASRDLDFLGIKFGYVRYIEPKRKKI
ncbi:MAG: hypothetical protein II652_00700 [Bacteroidales bacterium]|nr:hypothetical protein [Bacteroidales bacterium]